MQRAGDFDNMPKREALRHSRELEKLDRNLSGIANLDRVPDAIFVIDTKKEHIAVTEARKLGLPVVAVVDTNCDPDEVDFVIPGNDDALRSIRLFASRIADAYIEGAGQLEEQVMVQKKDGGPGGPGSRVPVPVFDKDGPPAGAGGASGASSAAPA